MKLQVVAKIKYLFNYSNIIFYKGYPLNRIADNFVTVEYDYNDNIKRFKTFIICGLASFISFILLCLPFYFLKPYYLGFIFVALYFVLHVLVYFIIFIIRRIKYKNKPVLSFRSDWFVEVTNCPKCQTGMIKHSSFRDGTASFFCGCFPYLRTSIYFICFDCKTVYPQTYLYKFIPRYPPWSPQPIMNFRNFNEF